jgi:hypothetical protein
MGYHNKRIQMCDIINLLSLLKRKGRFINSISFFPCIMAQYAKITNKTQLCRVMYYSLAALHVSSDIFAHHQEHLNCITASGITHVCLTFQYSHDTSRQRHTCVIPEAVIQFRCSWWWEKISLETYRAAKKEWIILHSCILLVIFVYCVTMHGNMNIKFG